MFKKIIKKIWKVLKWIRVFVIYKYLKKTTYGARVIISDRKKIFLVKHPYDNFWVLPGGGVNKNESVFEAGKRESQEEAGLVLNGELKILGRYFNNKENKDDYINIIVADTWQVSNKKRRLIDRIEIQKRDWFELDNLPNISIATKNRIKEFIENDYSKELRNWD